MSRLQFVPRRPIAALALAMALASFLPATAQDEPQSAKPDKSDKTGAAAPKPSDSFFAATTVTALGRETDSFEVATPVTVVPLQEIERRMPANPAALLLDQPGVDLNGVGPNQQRPVIRGQRGLRVLFLEDGLRLNNA
ncbi:MAG: Plug domain-containing protein, partial [Acidobacteriota bacterium]